VEYTGEERPLYSPPLYSPVYFPEESLPSGKVIPRENKQVNIIVGK